MRAGLQILPSVGVVASVVTWRTRPQAIAITLQPRINEQLPTNNEQLTE